MASEYDIVGAFQDIELDLIKSMKRNMKRHIGEEFQEDINWSQWQAEMLNGLAQFRNKLVDHVFLDDMKCPKNLFSRFPLWNNKVNMIGNLILALDYLNGVEESHFDLSLENKVWLLLDKYSIAPSRIGFISDNKTNQEAKRA